MPPDQAFLNEVRELWNRNFVAAILFARLNHERIPPEVGAIAQRMNQNFRANQAVHDAVNAAMGSLGIFGGGGGGFGPVVNPEEFMFYATMGLIVAHRGNPPAAPALQACARAVVTGQTDPFTVFNVANPQAPGLGGILRTFLALAPQIVPLVRNWALVTAALAVPGEQISGLLGVSPQQRFQEAMKAAVAAMQSTNTGEFHKQLGIAFGAAGETAGTDDDLAASNLAVLMGTIGLLKPEELRLALGALGRAAADEQNAAKAAPILTLAMPMIQQQGLMKELGVEAVRIASSLLKTAEGANRLGLALATATALLQLGRTAEAESLVSKVKGEFKAPDERMRIAQADADISWANGDNDGAADILVAALEDCGGASSPLRVGLLQKLISVWPAQREGLDPWLQWLQGEAARLEEPQASITRLTAGLALFKTGRQEQGRALVERVDLDMVEQKAPALRDMVGQIRESLKAFGLTRAS